MKRIRGAEAPRRPNRRRRRRHNRSHSRRRGRGLLALALIALALTLVGAGFFRGQLNYGLIYDGRILAAVEDRGKALEFLDSYLDSLAQAKAGPVRFAREVSVVKGFYPETPVPKTQEEFFSLLRAGTATEMDAVALLVDGGVVVHLGSTEAAQALLAEVREELGAIQREDGEVISAEFRQEITFAEVVLGADQVATPAAAKELLLAGPEPRLELEVVYEYLEDSPNAPAPEAAEPLPLGGQGLDQAGYAGEALRYRVVQVNGAVESTTTLSPGGEAAEAGATPLALAQKGDDSGCDVPIRGEITAVFGQSGAYWDKGHSGLDIAAPQGTPIYGVAPGVVIFAGSQEIYGNLVIIDHGDGLTTYYAHQSRLLVAEGQEVAAGALLGECGSTGRSTDPHLHFEVRIDGRAVDPQTSGLI